MKSILNRAIHGILRLAHRSARISDTDRAAHLQRAVEVQKEINTWVGNAHYEKVSLGQNCNSSWYLKATGNKRASYPFDWMFTTPEIIEDMISDNFEALLDRDQLIPHGTDAGHQRYHEWLFGHRNPATSAQDHAFFQRCVSRWNDLMLSQRPVLFVTVVLNEFEKRQRWREGFTKQFLMPKNQGPKDFEPMMNRIRSANPNSRFLFIEQYTEQPFELSVTTKNEQFLWLKFCSIDKNTGVQYLHELDDELMRLIIAGLDRSPMKTEST